MGHGAIVTNPPDDCPCRASLTRFFDALDAQASVSAQRVYACHRDLAEFSAFMAGRGRCPFEALEADITGFVHTIRGMPGAARRLRSIRLYFRFLVRHGLLDSDPADRVLAPGTLPHFSRLEHSAIKLPLSLVGIFVMNDYLQVPLVLAAALMVAGWILAILALPVTPDDRSTAHLTFSA